MQGNAYDTLQDVCNMMSSLILKSPGRLQMIPIQPSRGYAIWIVPYRGLATVGVNIIVDLILVALDTICVVVAGAADESVWYNIVLL